MSLSKETRETKYANLESTHLPGVNHYFLIKCLIKKTGLCKDGVRNGAKGWWWKGVGRLNSCQLNVLIHLWGFLVFKFFLAFGFLAVGFVFGRSFSL